MNFVLKRNVYVIIYEGKYPSDCKIDAYGNLYFLNSETDEISIIGYLDLYSGFSNRQYTLYVKDESNSAIYAPVALEVVDSEYLYYTNSANGDEAGSLNRAKTVVSETNSEEINIIVKNTNPAWGVAYVDSSKAFFSLNTGEIWSVDLNNPDNLYRKSTEQLKEPRKMCYGDGKIFIADHDLGEIVTFSSDHGAEDPTTLIKIQAVYSTFCVKESGVKLLLSLLALTLI